MNEPSSQILEERPSPWLWKLLGSCKAPVKLLETFFFQHDQVTCWVRTKKSGVVKKLNPSEKGLKTTWEVLGYFRKRFLQFQQYRVDPSGLCYCGLRDTRLCITPELYEDIAERRVNIAQCSYLQECRNDMLPSVYRFKMRVQDGVYLPEYTLTKAQEPGHNPQLLHKLTDTAKILVMVCRQQKHKAVTELELDFRKSESGDLWLIACNKCVLSQAASPEYVWRGNSPEESMVENTTETLEVEEQEETVVKSEYRLSVFRQLIAPHIKRVTTSQCRTGYYQSDFQELLLRKYLRENGLDMDKLQEQPALLSEFEHKYSLADDTYSATSSHSSLHKRSSSDVKGIDQAQRKTQLPAIRRQSQLFTKESAASTRSTSISLPKSGRR